MPTTMEHRSAQRHAAGIKGFIAGAVIGGVLAAIIGIIFSVLDYGEGGVPLDVAGGAAFGGLVGVMFAMIRARA